MVFGHTFPVFDYSESLKQDWENTVYANEKHELKEDNPMNLPTPLKKCFTMQVFIDSNHAGNQVTMRS